MGVIIYEDTLNKLGKHDAKNEWWVAHSIEVVRTRFDGKHGVPWDFGDYWSPSATNTVIDSKQHIGELAMDLGREHDRFRREIARANDAGCLLVVLVETTEAAELDDMGMWTNSHCTHCSKLYARECDPMDAKGICLRHGTRKPMQGPTLLRQMTTMQGTRCVRFEFIEPERSAEKICELLGVRY